MGAMMASTDVSNQLAVFQQRIDTHEKHLEKLSTGIEKLNEVIVRLAENQAQLQSVDNRVTDLIRATEVRRSEMDNRINALEGRLTRNTITLAKWGGGLLVAASLPSIAWAISRLLLAN